jgi:hypothetical protein
MLHGGWERMLQIQQNLGLDSISTTHLFVQC